MEQICDWFPYIGVLVDFRCERGGKFLKISRHILCANKALAGYCEVVGHCLRDPFGVFGR